MDGIRGAKRVSGSNRGSPSYRHVIDLEKDQPVESILDSSSALDIRLFQRSD